MLHKVGQSYSAMAGSDTSTAARAKLIALMCLIASPHVLYAFVWIYPEVFISYIHSVTTAQPLDVFARMGISLKFVEFFALLLWAWDLGIPLNFKKASATQKCTAVIYFSVGQLLNIWTYQSLGRDGVYYGARLGRPVPWVNGFPFSTLSHPQYIGCSLSAWGVAAIMVPATNRQEWNDLACIATLCYVITACIESYS
eukprot:gb/GEZN01021288.1/.p1 GENE.gb/GEZN01021288.1/~~gb/GEZN01021288.1/.p1  ORF type:complete len:198 (+),score=3.89 gb/GEZN01021288.1/:50-643(+)